jgi:Cu/Ag efflux protein CusF
MLALFLMACSPQQQTTWSRASARQYLLTGEIVRLELKTAVAVIKHEPIPGWMEGMTMEFPVESATEFNKLKSGARIRATVFVKDLDYWIGDIVLEKGESG